MLNLTIMFLKKERIFLDKLDGKAAIIPAANLVKHHADCEYPFRQDSNFWYLTGLMRQILSLFFIT